MLVSLSSLAIPYGGYWSSPFARWQGSFAPLHSLTFAAYVARRALAARAIDPAAIDYGVLGMTIPQKSAFYGAPWLMGEIGAPTVSGPTINQACATGVRILSVAASEILFSASRVALVIAADRTSNGPHVYYPAPDRPGGTGSHEDWVLDNFGCDPFARNAMIETAENVARKHRISRQEQHEVTLQRYAQYAEALTNDRAFQRRFMELPFPVPDSRFAKTIGMLDGDEGIHATTADGLSRLKPVLPDGSVTYGAQTHPADGTAGMIVTTPERAKEFSRDPKIAVRVLGFGQARADKGFMPEAPVPAARNALAAAGLGIEDMAVIKSHNPFVINDIVFTRAFGLETGAMNNFGSSLVWGHPQGPTGLRGVIELIEELALKGGGHGLFLGCAAGDTAMAVVVKVDDAR